ncbi:MAG: hypothetical protein K9H25_06675 [Rhodospirillum sp.]|nr:hypothetical protein [Rhodospirillum sp.]MCF8487691.1 hypothetical protein [Rhodospirillum sp.]MCF8499587.1 hypothetical protein [Rhodospirillum sp.]
MPDWGVILLGAGMVLIGALIGGRRGRGRGGQSGFSIVAKSIFGSTTQTVTLGNIRIGNASSPSSERKESRDVVGWSLGLIGIAVSGYGVYLTLAMG